MQWIDFQDRLDVSLKANENTHTHTKGSREQAFFSRVPQSKIQKLYTLYALDFEMFGYPVPHEYLEMGY